MLPGPCHAFLTAHYLSLVDSIGILMASIALSSFKCGPWQSIKIRTHTHTLCVCVCARVEKCYYYTNSVKGLRKRMLGTTSYYSQGPPPKKKKKCQSAVMTEEQPSSWATRFSTIAAGRGSPASSQVSKVKRQWGSGAVKFNFNKSQALDHTNWNKHKQTISSSTWHKVPQIGNKTGKMKKKKKSSSNLWTFPEDIQRSLPPPSLQSSPHQAAHYPPAGAHEVGRTSAIKGFAKKKLDNIAPQPPRSPASLEVTFVQQSVNSVQKMFEEGYLDSKSKCKTTKYNKR